MAPAADAPRTDSGVTISLMMPRRAATEATVAHVLVSKYADHLPLFRQAQIMSRQGVDLDRSTLADWVGRAAFELRPVFDALIAELYRIEAELRGLDPEVRLAGRQERSASLIADMQTWLVHHRAGVTTKSPLGEALAYIAKYWDGLKLFLTDGRIEIDNNSVERTIRPIALNRKNSLFAGHDAGAENWATITSLIEACKLNTVDPQAYLTATLTAIVNGHKQGQVNELMPWNYS